jgi:hypothetical protein
MACNVTGMSRNLSITLERPEQHVEESTTGSNGSKKRPP